MYILCLCFQLFCNSFDVLDHCLLGSPASQVIPPVVGMLLLGYFATVIPTAVTKET